MKTLKTLILLDTNFLTIPYKEGVDIFQEIARLMSTEHVYEVTILSSVVKELSELVVKESGEDKIAAKVGLQLIERKKIRVIENKKEVPADVDIADFAEGNKDVIVCTNDKELKKRLKKMGVKTISLRNKNHLEFS